MSEYERSSLFEELRDMENRAARAIIALLMRKAGMETFKVTRQDLRDFEESTLHLDKNEDHSWTYSIRARCEAHDWKPPLYLVAKQPRSCFGPDYAIVGFRMECKKCDEVKDVWVDGPVSEVEEVESQPVKEL